MGQTIELQLYREGKEISLPVSIQPIEFRKMNGEKLHHRLDGAILGEIHEQHLQRGRIDYLEVMEVEPGSQAAEAGFLPGDIIYSINKQLTRSFDEALALRADGKRGMIMNIQRGNRELYILLK
jgi:serine protease Do